jgi:hypothetical protein
MAPTSCFPALPTRRPRPPAVCVALLGALLLVGCGPRGEDPALAAQREAQATAALQRLEGARAAGQHEAAAIYAEELLERHPDSPAAPAVRAELDALQARAEADREARRLAGLWTYHAVDGEAGVVRTAYIHGHGAGDAAPSLRLVIRRHPEWGQSTYLLIGDGADFACQGECRAGLAFDDGPPEPFVISRAPDVDPPAVFLDDDMAVLGRVVDSQRLRLEVDLASGAAEYLFDLGGFDPGRLKEAPAATEPRAAQP